MTYTINNPNKHFKTPNGKVLEPVKILNSSLWGVQFTSGGELPVELKGKWTSVSRALEAIRSYIERKHQEAGKKEEVNEQPKVEEIVEENKEDVFEKAKQEDDEEKEIKEVKPKKKKVKLNI